MHSDQYVRDQSYIVLHRSTPPRWALLQQAKRALQQWYKEVGLDPSLRGAGLEHELLSPTREWF